MSVTGSDPSGSNGSTPSGVASFAIYVSTDNGPFTLFATVTPSNPSALLHGPGRPHLRLLQHRDRQRGQRPADASSAQATVQILAPLTCQLDRGRHPQPAQHDRLVHRRHLQHADQLSAPSTASALTLTDNGSPNLITSAVTSRLVSGSTYQIGGLAGLTTAEGSYALTVNAAGIQDPYGNPGTGIALDLLADGHDPADQHGQHAAGHRRRPRASPSRSPAPTRTGRTAARRRASRRSPSTSRQTAGPSRLWRPSRPPARRPSSPARPATPTASTASRPTRPATSRPTPDSAQQTVQILAPVTVTSIAAVSPNPRTRPSRPSTSPSACRSTVSSLADRRRDPDRQRRPEPDHQRRHASPWSRARPTRSAAWPA